MDVVQLVGTAPDPSFASVLPAGTERYIDFVNVTMCVLLLSIS